MILCIIFCSGKNIGKAPISTICSNKYSAGVTSESRSSNPNFIANVLAHELGHNLGMRHDHENKNCRCYDHRKMKCIMNHQLDEEVKSFSVCSKDDFERTLLHGYA